MANALYDLARQAFLNGGISYTSASINAALVLSTYTPNLVTDQYLSDVGGNVLGTAQPLTSKSSINGVANAAGVTFSTVTGSTCNYILIYENSGVPSTVS